MSHCFLSIEPTLPLPKNNVLFVVSFSSMSPLVADLQLSHDFAWWNSIDFHHKKTNSFAYRKAWPNISDFPMSAVFFGKLDIYQFFYTKKNHPQIPPKFWKYDTYICRLSCFFSMYNFPKRTKFPEFLCHPMAADCRCFSQKTISIWVFPRIMVPPNHPILIGFSIINHPFWGTPIFGNIRILCVISIWLVYRLCGGDSQWD